MSAQRLGLSDQETQACLVTKPGNLGATFVSSDGNGDSIDLTTLDAFFTTHQLQRLDLVKCDVEGFEERVLRGGERIIQQYRPVLYIEINPPTLQRAGTSAENLVAQLRSLGYDLMRIDRRRLTPMITTPTGEDYEDCFCIPRL